MNQISRARAGTSTKLQTNSKYQYPTRGASACAARDQNNQGMLSILIAVGNRSHTYLKASFIKSRTAGRSADTSYDALHKKGIVSV